MQGEVIVVFGGSGFIGKHVVRALAKRGARVRAAVRRPHLAHHLRPLGDVGQIQVVQANVRSEEMVARAVDGADVVINLVGLLSETGSQTFADVQAEGARRIAEAAAAAGVDRVVHVSAIGADLRSKSKYARAKAEAEAAVRKAVPGAVILRPSIVFGPEDGFFNRFGEMASLAPALPLIGAATKFQPVFVGDVAEAVANAVDRADARGRTYELGGPRVYTMKQLLRYILQETQRSRALVPLPFFIAEPLGAVLSLIFKIPLLGAPPLTADQVVLLKRDNVVATDALTLKDLGVTDLETVEAIAPSYLWRFRPYGQFQQGPQSS
ncbi:MAG: SDR family NAD(P)-dependent oxidoreductase [Alphaproteobacteria bacterium]|nr:SDR family NAD(P)-dependent oxidoreductase [Alphaproteobacteria bacterium]